MFNAKEALANGGRIVSGDNIPSEIKRIMEELGMNPANVRVIDMSGTILDELDDDARFLGEVINDEAEFKAIPADEVTFTATPEAQEFGVCGDPNCPGCSQEARDALMEEMSTNGMGIDLNEYFRQAAETEREYRSLNQEDDPVPQQDEDTPEPFMLGMDPDFDREVVERIVGGQIALQSSVDAIFGVLKKLLTFEELTQVDHLTGFNLAVEQSAQINRAEIIGQAKGYALAKYGFDWEDIPYEQQRQLIEAFERKANDA